MSFFKGNGTSSTPSFFGTASVAAGGENSTAHDGGSTFSRIPPIMTSFLKNFPQSVYQETLSSTSVMSEDNNPDDVQSYDDSVDYDDNMSEHGALKNTTVISKTIISLFMCVDKYQLFPSRLHRII